MKNLAICRPLLGWMTKSTFLPAHMALKVSGLFFFLLIDIRHDFSFYLESGMSTNKTQCFLFPFECQSLFLSNAGVLLHGIYPTKDLKAVFRHVVIILLTQMGGM